MRRTVLSLIFISAALFFLLPQILSSAIGKPFFIRILEKKFQANIEVNKLSLTWLGPQIFQTVRYAAANMESAADEVRSEVPLWFLSEMRGSFLLKNGNFSFLPPAAESQSLSGGRHNSIRIQEVDAALKNNTLKAKGKTLQGGSFSIEGKIYSKKDFDVIADISELPAITIDSLLKTKSLFKDILGDTVNLKGKMNFHQTEGTLNAFISSTYLTTSLQIKLTEEALYLKEPLKIVCRLTEAASRSLISSFSSASLTAIKAKNPIVLDLSEKGFSWHKPFSIKTLSVGNGSLDMGKIECQSGPSMNSLLSLFKKKTPSDQISLWLTPIVFHLDKGVLKIERTDALLADSIHLCCWGAIDTAKDSLNLFLGIPADTLRDFFGIKNVHPDYVLKIAVRGSIQKPEIETGSAIAKIAAMAASGHIPKAKKFLNPLIHIFSSVQEEGDAPLPKRPFPWER